MAFSKLKAHLRQASERTLEGLQSALAAALDFFPKTIALTSLNIRDMCKLKSKMLYH